MDPITLAKDATEIEIRIKVTATRYSGDEPPEPMFVSLHKTDSGWKIFDLRTEGVSVAKLYAGNFAAVLAREDRLGKLIELLEERNLRNAAQPGGKF